MTLPPNLPAFSPNFIMYCLGLASHVESLFLQSTGDSALTLTAIVPVFNDGGSIAKTIESLNDQTKILKNIIVVDDGSTDDSY